MLRLLIRSAVDDGTDNSPTRAPLSVSICLTVARSVCGTRNRRFASSVTNFTLRSAESTIAGAPAAMRTLAMLVMAGEADSTGNGSRGALGKGSGSGAIAVAAAAWPLFRGAAVSRGGCGCCGGAFGLVESDALARGVSTGGEVGITSEEAALAGAGCFGFLGLS